MAKLLSAKAGDIIVEAPEGGQWVTLREEKEQDYMLVVHAWHIPKLIAALEAATALID